MRKLFGQVGCIAIAVSTATLVSAQQSGSSDLEAFASPPESASTQPALLSNAQIREAAAALDSADAGRRSAAGVELMGLPREQLPLLHQCLERLQPISRATAVSLHEIVLQVYLAAEPYPCNRAAGFLGLRWGDTGLESTPRLGVPVGTRLLGFPSYRLLRTGDLILGLVLQPDVPLQQTPNLPTPDLGALQNAIRDAGASRAVVLDILREGERIRVPVTLYPALVLPPADIEGFTAGRKLKGETYWRDTFLPLVQLG